MIPAHVPSMKQSVIKTITFLSAGLLLLGLTSCSDILQQDNDAQSSGSSSVNFDYSELESSPVQQTALFGLQSSSVLYELGIDPTGAGKDVAKFRQEILNTPESLNAQSNIPTDLPATDAEFFRNQRAIYSYTRSMPESFREELKELKNGIFEELPQLRNSDGFWLGEAAQLVSPAEAKQVTADLVGSFIVNGAFQNGYTGWVAQIVVNFDTWEIIDYRLVEPEVLTRTPSEVEALATPSAAQDRWPNASYFRRIANVDTLKPQASQKAYNPYASPVALILDDGTVKVER